MGKASELRGLFFDLDGTLVDTTEPNIAAYKYALQRLGRSITTTQLLEAFGMRYDVFLPRFFPDISAVEMEEVRKLKAEEYPKHLHLARPNNELIDFVRTVREHHITTLVTMAQGKSARAVLEVCKIEHLFDHIISGDMVKKAKPDPEAYLMALDVAQLKNTQVLAFEDSATGIESAARARIATIRININSAKA